MHVTAPTITRIDAGKVLVSWTGTARLNAWIEVNGAFVHEDLPFADATRRKVVTVPAGGMPFALAVQEAEPDSEILPIYEAPTTEPTVQFDAVAVAKHYQLYHRAPGETTETVERTLPADERRRRYAVGLHDPLVHGWHYFRVESVDAYGRESTRSAWLYYAVDLPPYPATAVVTKVNEEFVLTIGGTTPSADEYVLVDTADNELIDAAGNMLTWN